MRSIACGALLACSAAFLSNHAFACSSCGCSLSSDWASQGYAAGEGLRFDLRADYFNQDELRSGRHAVDRGSLDIPNEREIQQKTINRNYQLAVDYGANADWAFSVVVPYFDRYHTTILEGDEDISTSHTKSIGDVRLLARYQALTESRDVGIQLGVKLPTGEIHDNFISGPGAGTPLDRGLQPGTGTTDLLLGIYHFGVFQRDWEYFAQALVQQPLNSRDSFRPGTGLNVNFGVRYANLGNITPQLQVNIRAEGREHGENADVENSGAVLAYLSPGVSVAISKKLQAYGFVQVPFYQKVNGFQIEPRYTVSIGLRYSL
jgi:hypothetical protein